MQAKIFKYLHSLFIHLFIYFFEEAHSVAKQIAI